LLARYNSDARTTDVVPLELGNCWHRKYLRGVKECRIPHWLQDEETSTARNWVWQSRDVYGRP